jgi:cytochrome c oxidase cbb3-type subunit IV
MAILNIFTDASSAVTVISLITFLGILWWTFGIKRSADFDAAASLPFADEIDDAVTTRISQRDSQRDPQKISKDSEKHHG